LIDGLVLASDKTIFDEFNLNFSKEVSSFEHANSIASAQELLKHEPYDYLLIIEKKCIDIQKALDGLMNIDTFKGKPILCCTTSSKWSDREKLWKRGVKDIIHIPISKEELEIRFTRFINDIANLDIDDKTVGMQGKLEDYNLLDIIQTIEQNKKSGILNLYYGRVEGKIWFYNGNICDAKFRSLEKMDAIFKLMTWMRGDFSMAFTDEEYEQKIELDTQQILLEAIQFIDQRNKILDELPDINEILLISTMADLEHMKAEEANYLRFFHGGQSISAFLSDFDIDELELLEIVKSFVASNYLMTREEFDNHMTQQEREEAEAGLKNVFKKFFRSKDQIALAKKEKEISFSGEFEQESLDEEGEIVAKLESFFKPDEKSLNRYKKEVEKL
jgi:hypothetical protein